MGISLYYSARESGHAHQCCLILPRPRNLFFKKSILHISVAASSPDFSLPEMQCEETQHPVPNNDTYQDTNPLARPTRRVAVSLQHTRARNLALRRKRSVVHAFAAGAAAIGALREFVDHHALEDVRLVARDFR